MSAAAIADFAIEVAIPCVAWIEACPAAEAIAAEAADLALARALLGRLTPGLSPASAGSFQVLMVPR